MDQLEQKLEDVPIVHDFFDAFHEKLLGLPLQQEIEFCIDVILVTDSILIPLYRKDPTKLKELKVQL